MDDLKSFALSNQTHMAELSDYEYKIEESARFQPLQKYYLNLLDRLGFRVAVCWTKDQVKEFLEGFHDEVQTAQVSGASAPEDDGAGSTSSTARSRDGQDSNLP